MARKIASKEVSCVEVTQAHLDRICATDSDYGSFLTVTPEKALADAASAQARVDAGERMPLLGVPYAAKDNLSTRDIRTTCASKILDNYVPPFDATVIEKLAAQGLVLMGKTNLDEFAMGTSCENSAYQLTRNPWDLERSPGGSSGGSCASVCGEQVPLSLGSDTGGSIRMPAAVAGIVGYKPTYGRVSRYGLVAFGSSLDQIGPFGRTVEDVALFAEAFSGHDPLDSTSLNDAPISTATLKQGSLKGLRVALPQEFFSESLHPGVRKVVDDAIQKLTAEGVSFTSVSLPSIAYGVTTYYIIAPAEASSNLARFDGIRYGPRLESNSGHVGVVEKTRAELFGHEVKARIMIGTYALSAGYYDAYYVRAQQVRGLMRQEFNRTFQDFDVVLGPTSPIPAFKIGELTDDPMALKLLDFCTIPANMIGAPAISINAGLTEGLPVGIQLMSAAREDERLLQIAYAVEQALGATVRPPI
jgi:aspartyl-tRNA(Asn)/glutamyl-tRNA(Gln) amidotransferase subunit A